MKKKTKYLNTRYSSMPFFEPSFYFGCRGGTKELACGGVQASSMRSTEYALNQKEYERINKESKAA